MGKMRTTVDIPDPVYRLPKDWGDSYLAAFASAAQLTVVTFDRTFSNKVRSSILL